MKERGVQLRSGVKRTERQVIDEIASEFSTEELLEFLEADQRPSEADPAFRERLREELWQLLQRSQLREDR